jgi:internalin A
MPTPKMSKQERGAYDKALRRIEKARGRWWREARTSLDLSSLGLTKLPSEIGQLTALTWLDLNGNRLTTLPREIGQLMSLTQLDLRTNQFTTLPPEIGQLTALTWLHLNGNRLTTLPREIGQLMALTRLHLYSNQLTTLPPEIGQLAALARLDLSENQLTTLPPEIGQLTSLTELYLFNNQLTTLPPEIGQLTSLTKLYLFNNQFTTLPPEIGQLASLTQLHLHDNQLTTLPPEIGQLTALEQLFLHGNPDLGIPEDALGPTFEDVYLRDAKPKPPKEILDYYFATRGREGVALREMKLIVVGWGKAGKTTLVKRLAGEPMDPSEPETHGIMIRPLTLDCTDGKLQARVWDFGGQHVLHAMHEFFLTARSLYLLVLEQRSDRAETDAKYWLQLIRSYAPQAPVVVAMNKSRGIERPLDRESLEKAYGPIAAWVATECLPEDDCPGAAATIAKLRQALTAAAEERWMPEPRKRFPRKWVAIKKWLEGLDKDGTNYLDYGIFARECAARGEPDAQKQAEVAALMHDLGIAMNYARDERLRDTTVLRPDWLANGIYAVLRANLFVPGKPLAPDAVLTPEKLGEIYAVAARKPVEMLKARDYPAEKWEFLLRLMNLFQLSFPLSEDGKRQLCPTLLRAEPPPGTDEPQGDDVVRLRYEFAVVPAPLLPRFMVRTFSLIEQAKLWQRGAMLRYPDARARVWTTAEEKYLFATVAGPEGERTDLLSIIRNTLVELFGEYKELQVTEQRWFDGHWVPRATLERFGVLDPEWAEDIREEEASS